MAEGSFLGTGFRAAAAGPLRGPVGPTQPQGFGAADVFAEERAVEEMKPGAFWSTVGTIASVLDTPRRALWTGVYMAAGHDADVAWREAESAQNLLRDIAPEFFQDHPWLGLGLGIGLEIATDPLTWIGIGALTKAGKHAAKTGKLALTHAQQAVKGQRAFLQVFYPTLRAGRVGLGRLTVKAPGLVAARAALGRKIAYPFSLLFGKTRSAIPAVRAAQEIAAEGLVHPSLASLRLRDEHFKLMQRLGPEGGERAMRLAEHLADAAQPTAKSPFHARFLRGATLKELDDAMHFRVIQDSLDDIKAGVLGWTADKNDDLHKFIARMDKVADSELLSVNKKAAKEMGRQLKLTKNHIAEIAGLKSVVRQNTTMADELSRAIQMNEVLESGGAVSMTLDPEQLVLAKRKRMVLLRDAQKAEAHIIRLDADMVGAGQRVEALRRAPVKPTARLLEAQAHKAEAMRRLDEAPAYIAHIVDAEGRRKIAQTTGKAGAKLRGRLWTAGLQEELSRQFLQKWDRTTLPWTPVGKFDEMGNAVKNLMSRDLSLDEILELEAKALKGLKPGTRAEKHAPLFTERGGLLDRITDWWNGTLKTEATTVGRFYKTDPLKWFDSVVGHNLHQMKSRLMVDAIQQTAPDLLSDVAKPGWSHIRDVSHRLQEVVGNKWVHPELFQEMVRVPSNLLAPGANNLVLRGIDWFTKHFKRAVTQPWPAYHFRNNVSDMIKMTANGGWDVKTVFDDGFRIAGRRADVMIDVPEGALAAFGHFGKQVPADDFYRIAQAHNLLYGQQSSMGLGKLLRFPEDVRRTGYFLDRIRHGYAPFQAAQQVQKVLFNYADMSPQAREVWRRVIPFWSWLSHNVRHEALMLATHPGYSMAQLRVGGQVEKIPGIPPWVRGRMMMALQPDKQTGEERFLIGLGLPIEDVAELLNFSGGAKEWLRQIGFRANPALKAGIAIPTGYDIERGRALDQPVNAPYLRWLYEHGPKDAISFMERRMGARRRRGRKRTYYTIDPYFDFVMRVLPTTRVYSSAKTLADEKRHAAARAYGFITGQRVIRYDPERSRRMDEQRAAQALIDAARRVGDIGIYEVPYARRGGLMGRREVRRLTRERYGR